MARIELVQLSHSYQGDPQESDYVLRNVDLHWQDGVSYALVGPSGCGKSTLLNIISGLVTPSEGRVLYDGEDVTRRDTRARNIAQVFQFPVLYDTMTVFDNLAFPLRNRGLPAKAVKARVEEIADILDLGPLLARKAARLSADLKQIISLGRGLVRKDVAAILFDEPLTVIDPHLKWELRCKLRKIYEQFKLTLIYVTHDQTEALTFADQVLVMKDGLVLQQGSPEDLHDAPAHTFVGYFIGSPGMNFLPCDLDNGAAVVAGQRIPLRETLKWPKGEQVELKLGIRPENIQILTAPADDAVELQVERVQDLGNFLQAQVRLGEHVLQLKSAEDAQIRPGETVLCRFPLPAAQLYADDLLVRERT